jgi:hypothetical protein
MKYCKVCGSNNLVESHHIIKRSQAPVLIKCEINQIDLCYEHHKGTYGVHGKCGHKLDQRLKLEFQNKLELLLDKQYLTKEDIRQALNITLKATDRLCKTLNCNKGVFAREEVLRACMGGKLILESEVDSND